MNWLWWAPLHPPTFSGATVAIVQGWEKIQPTGKIWSVNWPDPAHPPARALTGMHSFRWAIPGPALLPSPPQEMPGWSVFPSTHLLEVRGAEQHAARCSCTGNSRTRSCAYWLGLGLAGLFYSSHLQWWLLLLVLPLLHYSKQRGSFSWASPVSLCRASPPGCLYLLTHRWLLITLCCMCLPLPPPFFHPPLAPGTQCQAMRPPAPHTCTTSYTPPQGRAGREQIYLHHPFCSQTLLAICPKPHMGFWWVGKATEHADSAHDSTSKLPIVDTTVLSIK